MALSAQTHKLRVNDPELAKELIAHGGKLVADYGGFQVIESAEIPSGRKATDHMQVEDRLDVVELSTRAINTRSPEAKTLRRTVGAFAGKRLHLVQFVGPIKPEWVAALEENGGHIVTYIPNDAYLIYADTSMLARMQAWANSSDYVQWDGDFTDDDKIHPSARATNSKGEPQEIGTDTFAVQMVDDAEANTATMAVIDRLKLAPVKSTSHVLNYLNIIVRLPADRLAEIAKQPEVISIQPRPEPHLLDERQDQIISGHVVDNTGLPTGPGYLGWLASKGFTQAQFTSSGFLVDLSDSGIDNGTTSPGHFALYQFGNPANSSRVVYNRLEGSANSGSTLQGCDGHGNLNSHIIGAYCDMTNFPHTDSTGYRYGLGVCPFVSLGSSVIFDPNNFTSPNYTTLQSQAYTNGARISANSWGSPVNGAYNSDSQTYDALVRNSSSTFVGTNRPMIIVFAAGNAGPASTTLDSPGSAKNVITVGAAENVRSMSIDNGGSNANGNDGCSTLDTDADNANDMTDFSSRGPCADGRMKPEIVAPGSHITGGAPQNGTATTNGTGNDLTCFTGSGICGLPGSGTAGAAANFFPSGQQFYTESSGTSHSTPCVAGACALVRQYFINSNYPAASPAMTKAFLVSATRYMSGVFANDNLWSISQGMGELDLGTAFDGVARVLRDQVASDTFTNTGPSRIFTGNINDPSKPFRVTVAWTDAPGALSASTELVNDLDLTVTAGGNTYKGNVFHGAFSRTGGNADHKNNMESVFLPAGLTGAYEVKVTAANISGDGIANISPATDQDFALVIYNATASAEPVITFSNVVIASESCSAANGAIDPGETVTVNFALQNIGNVNTTNLVATLLTTNGVTSPSGPQTYGVLTTNGGAVFESFTFSASGSCGGTVTAVLQLQDGAVNLGTISYNFTLGTLAPIFTENFDGVTQPALPAGWTTTSGGGEHAWVTTNSVSDSAPNSIFSNDATTKGSNTLVSPSIQLPAGLAQLSFRNSYNLEVPAGNPNNAFDGGLLEIKIGAGSFQEIQAAGGFFSSGGYNRTINASSNPFNHSQVWSGNSGGFTNTVVQLPDAAGGQTVQFRWRCASDNNTAQTGWWIDSVVVSASQCCTGAVAEADMAIGKTVQPSALNVTSNLTFTISVTNFGPNTASAVVVTDALPVGLIFTNASVSQGIWTNNGNLVSAALGSMVSNATATFTIQAVATLSGQRTNVAVVSSSTGDTNAANNSASAVVAVNSPPTCTGITNVITAEDTVAGPIGFTVGDAETLAGSLIVSGISGNTTLIPNGNIAFGGSGANRTVTLTPAANQNGSALITITVSDGAALTNISFTLNVTAVNDVPTCTGITNVITDEDVVAGPIGFTIGDVETPAGSLIVSGISGNTMLIPNANIVFGGSGANRTVTMTPATNQDGSALITITVSDGSASTNTSFTLTVNPVNDAPVLAPVADRTVHAGTLVTVTNHATDVDLPPQTLTFSLDVAPGNAAINSTNGIFSWQTTDANANTTTNVTVRVTDSGAPPLSDTKNFTVTVVPRPYILSITVTNMTALIKWTSISGLVYQVNANGDLLDTNWTNLVPNVTANSTNASTTDPIGTNAHKFYRVAPLP